MYTDESRFALQPDDKRNRPENITEHHAFQANHGFVVFIGISYRHAHLYRRSSVMAVRNRDGLCWDITPTCTSLDVVL